MVQLSACALMLVGAAGGGAGGGARLVEVAFAAGAGEEEGGVGGVGRWGTRLLEAAEAVAAARGQRVLVVRAEEGTDWWGVCAGRGYGRAEAPDGGWLVRRL